MDETKVSVTNISNWVEWIHVSQGDSHCDICLALDRRWFIENRCPQNPLHFFCHCILNPLSFNTVEENSKSTADLSKFNKYLFVPTHKDNKMKWKMFESWGYDINDSEWMRDEIQRQGLDKYVRGNYSLGKLDQYGQRINIRVEIPKRYSSEMATFITGWMVYPNGEIILTTPYGDK